MSNGIDKLVAELAQRAHAIIEEGYSRSDIMKSAMQDFKSLGSMSGMLSFMTTGKLNSNQVELAKRIAVRVIAVLGTME